MSSFAARLVSKIWRIYRAAWVTAIQPFRTLMRRYLPRDRVLVQVNHLPIRYARRSEDFTANVCGILAPSVRSAEYRLNGGPWHKIQYAVPRVPFPKFTLELSAAELVAGCNTVEVKCETFRGRTAITRRSFTYDPTPVHLPIHQDWSDTSLDVQDGHWERVSSETGFFVRPVLGTETYDRILAVTGAFGGGRQITTELTFRAEKDPETPFGFGILPMWGGRPDSRGYSPRGGWNFSLVWYYSKYEAIGMEFSFKDAHQPPDWTAVYRNFDLERNGRYRIVVRCWPEGYRSGVHRRFVQQMKWWKDGDEEPAEWMELVDNPGAPILGEEFSVALIAHQAQVEFGPVSVQEYIP